MDAETEADRRLIGNERAKLTATYVNGLAIAVFAVGGLAPLVAAVAPRPDGVPGGSPNATPHAVPWGLLAVTAFCWLASGALHLVARRRLPSLRA